MQRKETMHRRMPEERSEAQVRGAIDAGACGDKKPGFDPAAAPMETDAESGNPDMMPDPAGQPGHPRWTDTRDMADSDGDAMRAMPSAKRRPVRGFGWPFLIIMACLAAVSATLTQLAGKLDEFLK